MGRQEIAPFSFPALLQFSKTIQFICFAEQLLHLLTRMSAFPV